MPEPSRAFLAAASALAALTAALLLLSWREHPGALVYALDDAYIHMATARNLALDGVWGVSASGFSASTSSLLWPAAIALVYLVTGVQTWVPLVLSFLGALLVLHSVARACRALGLGGAATLIVLSVVVVAAPLAPLVLTGLEHTLHAALTLAFALLATRILAREPERGPPAAGRETLGLAGLAAVLAATRYEGLFTVAVVCLLLLVRRMPVRALVTGAAALLPALAFGLYSLERGWWLLPAPVLLKGATPDPGSLAGAIEALGYAGYRTLVYHPVLLFLALGALALLWLGARARRRFWNPAPVLVAIFLGTVLLHAQFARTGSFFRYEAYLVILGLVAVLAGALSRPAAGARVDLASWPGAARVVAAVLALFLAVPFAVRAATSHALAARATRNIHEQQIQMGRFLREHYPGATVAVNDIGAVSFLAGVRCVDLLGLATIEVARQRRRGTFTVREIDAICRRRGVEIALLYEPWYAGRGGLPAHWTRVGAWRIRDNYICGWHTVSFFAVSEDPARLAERLARFSPSLPPRVDRLTLEIAAE